VHPANEFTTGTHRVGQKKIVTGVAVAHTAGASGAAPASLAGSPRQRVSWDISERLRAILRGRPGVPPGSSFFGAKEPRRGAVGMRANAE
jgi:hypothetical protein